jgi:stage IV sporulation protein FB
MKNLKIKVHWSFLLLGILMLFFGKLQTFFWCLLCVILHEMGHSIIGKKLGYKLNIITLMPYGAMLSGQSAPFSESDEIKIAIAGPLVNAILIILSIALWWIFPSLYNFTYDFVLANIFTLSFNILPVYPLDGGRICLAMISKNMGRAKAYKVTKIIGFVVTGIIFILFFISFIYKLNYMLGINALFMLIGLMENDTDVYYQKLNNFERFRFNFGGCVKLSENDTIFEAYKQVVENKAKEVVIIQNNHQKKFSKNDITSKILTIPINTMLKNI